MSCQNHSAVITGKVSSEVSFSHYESGESFYKLTVESRRLSGRPDYLPIMISKSLYLKGTFKKGTPIKVIGQIQTFNKYSSGKRKLLIYVFASDILIMDKVLPLDINQIILEGFICKKPVYRITPLKREIADVLLAVNRTRKKSDYIPLIAWERNARLCEMLNIGHKIKVWGRLQSRDYKKTLESGEIIEKTAFEISVSRIRHETQC